MCGFAGCMLMPYTSIAYSSHIRAARLIPSLSLAPHPVVNDVLDHRGAACVNRCPLLLPSLFYYSYTGVRELRGCYGKIRSVCIYVLLFRWTSYLCGQINFKVSIERYCSFIYSTSQPGIPLSLILDALRAPKWNSSWFARH